MVQPPPVDQAAQGRVFPRWLVVLAIVACIGVLLYVLRGVLTPVFFAFLIAYMLDPVVDALEARRIPRALGIAILLTLVLGALLLFLVLVVPGIVRDAIDFAGDLPAKLDALLRKLEPWLAQYDVEIPHSVDEALTEYEIDTTAIMGEAAAPAAAVLGWVVGGTASFVGAVAGLLMVPVFAFYLLYDFDRMIAAIKQLIPWRVRPFVVDVTREVDEVLGQFVRGQLIVMLILAVLYAVGYSIVGIRLAVVIGIVAGLLSFIPYVGGAVALGLALLMCFLDFGGWGQVAGVVVVYGAVQLLEGFVVTPKIVGDKVGLSAVWVLFALMVAGDLFGFMGVLLAVPAAAVIKIFVMRGVAWYRKSPMFLAGAPPEESPAEVSTDDVVRGILAEEGLPDEPEVARDKAEAAREDEVDDERSRGDDERGDSPNPDPPPAGEERAEPEHGRSVDGGARGGQDGPVDEGGDDDGRGGGVQ